MSGVFNSIFGGGGSTTVVQPAEASAEEKALIGIQTELSKRALAASDQLAPFQKELIDLSLADLRRQSADAAAENAAVPASERAALIKQDFDRSKRLGPIQEELLSRQLDDIRRGGAATPEQLQRIKEAADAGISAGTADIDASTQRGIGMIADELANSRGLRLSDSPIKGEAALLAREGEIQKGSLIKNLRAGEAASRLNFPLAASQITSGINLSTQNVADAARNFQADLRQRAFQNRMTVTGQTSQTGLGLSSIGNPAGAISGLAGARGRTQTTSGGGINLGGLGAAASGVAAIGGWLWPNK